MHDFDLVGQVAPVDVSISLQGLDFVGSLALFMNVIDVNLVLAV